ncbi:MAG TPA: prephenate dehydrogenase [Candidatus Corynebacterium avicola]|uniref:Prephenate dehydrogenase n=1 Tax=Candidatus Corynebacterium avicola TaxID=2838527 RepID=A0A9D1UL69_9CORY|nr:prephenate dehydrogenase [Candidatus Corynebacterium avicola]
MPTSGPAPVCVLGLGLIGGSLLRDLREAGRTAFGWNRSEATVDAAREDGFDVSGDLTATLQRAAEQDALIVLGVPFPALSPMLDAVAEHAPDCGLTDVTSVKGDILDLVKEKGLDARFVGGHPMAGTADSGWSATTTGLFSGAVWVVTHDNAPSDTAADHPWISVWRQVVELAATVGAAAVPARATKHDDAVARISHLPHVLAEALAITAYQGGALALSLAATSFRDSTRVAGTAPELVRAMCENNRDALVGALDETISMLTAARISLADPDEDLTVLTRDGHDARLRFEARAGRTREAPSNRPFIRVRPGTPGWLEQLHYAESVGAQIGVLPPVSG